MTTPEQRLAIARIVAEHWRDAARKAISGELSNLPSPTATAVLAVSLRAYDSILAALDGEADRRRLGVSAGPDAQRIDAAVQEGRRN